MTYSFIHEFGGDVFGWMWCNTKCLVTQGSEIRYGNLLYQHAITDKLLYFDAVWQKQLNAGILNHSLLFNINDFDVLKLLVSFMQYFSLWDVGVLPQSCINCTLLYLKYQAKCNQRLVRGSSRSTSDLTLNISHLFINIYHVIEWLHTNLNETIC